MWNDISEGSPFEFVLIAPVKVCFFSEIHVCVELITEDMMTLVKMVSWQHQMLYLHMALV